jgi:acetyl esterase/lipase
MRPLTADDTIQDLLSHPAFAGFGRLLLPWDDRPADSGTRLRDVGSLLRYHSHVDAETVVSALNHMIGDARSGRALFYDFYTEREKAEQPARSNTGLFFVRGKPGAPFAIIAPGGGFSYVASLHEGFPYAVAIQKHGLNAFVLKYRVGSGGRPATRDLAAAISYVFRNAKTLGVGTEAYSLWGSSAGARMAAAIGSHGPASFGGDDLPGPAAVVMAYTGHSEVAPIEPPTFVVVGEHD